MGYPQKEGKYGIIYQVAAGITVLPDEYGTWMVMANLEMGRKKKAFGKSEEDMRRAIKAAELLAVKMGLTLEKQQNTETKTFEMLIREWYGLNEQRW
jgi:hypothetical protein